MKYNQKLCMKTKKVINRGKGIKTTSEVKPVKNISENLQSFLERSSMQKEVLPSHIMQDHTFMSSKIFQIKGRYSHTEKLPESIESSKFLESCVIQILFTSFW